MNRTISAKVDLDQGDCREPIKFLFLPKMGLLGSQASNENNNFGYEL